MTEPATPAEARRLPRLTSLRWYAAALVFAFHLQLSGFHWGPLRAATFGYSGVGFFFILSGFVLRWSSRPGQSTWQFYRRRFARIYPSHVALLAVLFVLIGAGTSRAWIQPNWEAFGADLLLLQAWFPHGQVVQHWNPVSWSLSAEAFF